MFPDVSMIPKHVAAHTAECIQNQFILDLGKRQ